MLFCLEQFMVLYGMTPVVKHKLCYHKENVMYYEEHAVDIKECIIDKMSWFPLRAETI